MLFESCAFTWLGAGVSSGVSWMVGMSSFSHGGFFLWRLLFLLLGSSMLAASPDTCQLGNTNREGNGFLEKVLRQITELSQAKKSKVGRLIADSRQSVLTINSCNPRDVTSHRHSTEANSWIIQIMSH